MKTVIETLKKEIRSQLALQSETESDFQERVENLDCSKMGDSEKEKLHDYLCDNREKERACADKIYYLRQALINVFHSDGRCGDFDSFSPEEYC